MKRKERQRRWSLRKALWRPASSTKTKGGRSWALLGGFAAVAIVVGVGSAAVPAPDGTITGCIKTKGGDDDGAKGSLRVVDNASECKKNEQALSWSQQGPAGPAGANGPAGPEGPAGAMGVAGPQGLRGETGAQGLQGNPGEAGATGTAGSAGPKGDVGAAGPTGPSGARGETGEAGAQGPAGSPGPQGQAGPIGPAGPQGAAGLQGPAGPSGASAALSTGPGAPVQLKTTSLNTSVRRLTLPAGTYLIVASGRLESFTNSGLFDNGVRHVRCRLTAGSTTVYRGVTLGPLLAAGSSQTVAFDLVQTFGAPDAAEVHCWVADILDDVKAFDTTISAIKAG